MDMTVHAKIRQQQRGIPPLIVDLLIDFGAVERAGDGTTKHYFDKAARRRIRSYAGKLAGLIEQYLDCYAVVSPENKVITIAPRTERIRH